MVCTKQNINILGIYHKKGEPQVLLLFISWLNGLFKEAFN